ncbi:MAG: LysE family transporter [Ornithinimicrobium sp.]
MVDVSVLPTFIPAVLIILLAPGPDMAFMVAAGAAGGRRAATWAALGVTLGVTSM